MAVDFESLREKLKEEDWPSVYLFKFIVPSDHQKIALVTQLFNEETAEMTMRPSKNGKYTSISIKEVMTDADKVIDIYNKANTIDGIIIL